MYLIVGLGNPEPEYSNTRHNMGFDVINKLSEEFRVKINKSKFNSLYETCTIKGEKCILLKPQTYMNNSGIAVREFKNFYKISSDQIIIIYDDIDIEKGKIRIRKKGEAGSHNGVKSIVAEIGTNEFPRIRVGTGQPEHKSDLVNYVLESLKDDERIVLDEGIIDAKNAIIEIIENGIDIAMNKFN